MNAAEEAWDDLLFGRGVDEDSDHLADSLSYYTQVTGRSQRQTEYRTYLTGDWDIQPEFHQLKVSQLHRETEKAWLVSGTITFENEFKGLQSVSLDQMWLPKSQCLATGSDIRMPHWLVNKRLDNRDGSKRRAVVDIKIPF